MIARNWVEDLPSSTAFAINRVLYDIQHDPEVEARFRADPPSYLAAQPGLSENALSALIKPDVGGLYTMGANPYLLRAYCLQLRMPEAEYLASLRAVGSGDDHG